MVWNVYDIFNAFIALLLMLYMSFKYDISNKVLALLLLHYILVCVIDVIFDYNYWPDQFTYLHTVQKFRDFFLPKDSLTVVSAGFIFSLFPLFLQSVKSLAFVNYILYVLVYIFILTKFKTNYGQRLFKIVYLLYPSLILFTSLGLRDFLISTFMITSLYYLIIKKFFFKSQIYNIVLLFIKPQNFLLILLCGSFLWIISIKNNVSKFVLFILFMIFVVFIAVKNYDLLLHYRIAMFLEDTGMTVYDMPQWSIQDIYRVLLAPFFFDARNAMQLIQSFENLILAIFIIKILKLANKLKVNYINFLTINFFAITSSLIYSFAVFNYGTLTRYKFPCLFSWVIIILLLIDESIALNERINY